MYIHKINSRQHRGLKGTGSLASSIGDLTGRIESLTRVIVPAFFIVISLIGRVNAQTGQTLYFMERLPQSALLNPAYQHTHNFHLGLPLLSSLNLDARTNFISFSDLIFKHPQYDSLISFLHPDANLSDFTGKLKERNMISPDLHLNIFSFGFRVNGSFFSFSVSERASFRATLPKDLLLFGLEGNEQFAGEVADFSYLGADLNYFREYAAGYSLQVGERLNLGGRAKLLFGKANLSFSDSRISLYTDPDTYHMRLQSTLRMNMSMPVTLIRKDNGDIDDLEMHFNRDDYDPMEFIFNSRNTGFAVDLGATYKVIEPLTLYASITDLGFINWKQDIYNLSMDSEYEFEGVDLSPLFDSSDDSSPGDNLLDSLKGLFRINDTRDYYRRGLPARVYLGGAYRINRAIGFGLLSRSGIYQNRIEQAFTLSANSNIGRWLSASVSWSVMNNSYNNVGMGVVLRGGGFQLYLLSDNLNTIFMPHKANSVNLWLGLNLVFGHKRERVSGTGELPQYDAPRHVAVAAKPAEEEAIPDPDQREEEPGIDPAEVEPVAEEVTEVVPVVAEPVAEVVPVVAEPVAEVVPVVAEPVAEAVTVIAEPEVAEEAVQAPVVPVTAPEPLFYLVAGSFENMRNASAFAETMRNRGYESGVVYSEPSRYRVYIYAFDNRSDALKMIDNLRSRSGSPEVWLLRQ